jgi:hypothetical protein
MTIDMTAPEIKAAIEAAVEDAVSGLKAKNIDLASRLEKARQGKTIDPDDYRQLEERAAKLETDLIESNKQLKAISNEYDKTKKAHESESEFTRKLLVDNGLVDALTKAGVTDPVRLKAAKAMLKESVNLSIDGDVRRAMMGDKDLDEGIKIWAASDEGKYFVAAPNNAGGGAVGGGGKANAADALKMTPQQRMDVGRK